MRHGVLLSVLFVAAFAAAAQAPNPGREVFTQRCAGCHGTDGNGGELGPGIATRVPTRTDQELSTLLRQGLPASGMPSFPTLSEQEAAVLIAHLRALKPRAGTAPQRAKVTVAGAALEG